MTRDADDLDDAIQYITQQLEILRGIWEGQDADKFFGVARDYFENMSKIPQTMRKMGKFVDRANGDLNDGDETFSQELKTEVDDEYIDLYEQDGGNV